MHPLGAAEWFEEEGVEEMTIFFFFLISRETTPVAPFFSRNDISNRFTEHLLFFRIRLMKYYRMRNGDGVRSLVDLYKYYE